LDSIRARAREEMTSKFVQVGGGGGGRRETLDKKKRYHKRWNKINCCCCDKGRPTRSHFPLIKMDGSEVR
jgi:hypothetical protein